ncbi:hypothetical protein BDC45DRAFT_536648 [Circinella umbellata]|nr:hypothetical protein BDC45DRAFT_536648 [Circinella umbellata]
MSDERGFRSRTPPTPATWMQAGLQKASSAGCVVRRGDFDDNDVDGGSSNVVIDEYPPSQYYFSMVMDEGKDVGRKLELAVSVDHLVGHFSDVRFTQQFISAIESEQLRNYTVTIRCSYCIIREKRSSADQKSGCQTLFIYIQLLRWKYVENILDVVSDKDITNFVSMRLDFYNNNNNKI